MFIVPEDSARDGAGRAPRAPRCDCDTRCTFNGSLQRLGKEGGGARFSLPADEAAPGWLAQRGRCACPASVARPAASEERAVTRPFHVSVGRLARAAGGGGAPTAAVAVSI